MTVNNRVVIREKVDRSIRLRAVGDMNFGGFIGGRLKREETYDPLPAINEILGDAELALFNLECCPVDNVNVIQEKSKMASPAIFLDKIRRQFNVASIANNHMLDLGFEVFFDTLDQLQKRDFIIIGGGDNIESAKMMKVITINNIRVGFLASADFVNAPHGKGNAAKKNRPGVAIFNPREFIKQISSCKPDVDVLICSVHTGLEFNSCPDPVLMKHCKSMVTAGANVILIHHAHVRQGIELYENGIIAYGLGNFIFHINDPYMQQGEASTDTGLILDIILDRSGVVEYSYRIAKLQASGETSILSEEETQHGDQANLNNKLLDAKYIQIEWKKTCRRYFRMRLYSLYWAMKKYDYRKFFHLILDLKRRENMRWVLGLLNL